MGISYPNTEMASSMLMSYGNKVRFIIYQLSPWSTKASKMFYRNKQIEFFIRPYSSDSTLGGENRSVNGTGQNNLPDGADSEKVEPINYKKVSVKCVPDSEIKKSVFISQSHDIFTNLALEDWFYRNFNFTNHHVLLLWSNDPCVVIGQHQNPFNETNVSKLQNAGIALARRFSGGGTVYHDRGNMNITFFTPRERYNRKYNLNIVTRALFREWGIKADISPRDDIVINEKKVANTYTYTTD